MKLLFWPLAIALWIGCLYLIWDLIRRVFRLTRGLKPLRIYIAGPYSVGDPAANTLTAITEADKLLNAGYYPFIPHLSHYHHAILPHDYETWMELDFEYLAVCDVLIRLPGESPGADREVTLAKQRGIPVFYGVEAFLEVHGERRA